jgi:hypothetical protein
LLGFGFRDDGEDHHRLTVGVNVVENPDVVLPQSILRAEIVSEPFDAAFADQIGLMSQMSLDGIKNRRLKMLW